MKFVLGRPGFCLAGLNSLRRQAVPGRSARGLGGEPLWIIPKRARDIFHSACRTANRLKQAAPGNVSTRVRFVGPVKRMNTLSGTIDKTSRAVVRRSRLFNIVFGLRRLGKNITNFWHVPKRLPSIPRSPYLCPPGCWIPTPGSLCGRLFLQLSKLSDTSA